MNNTTKFIAAALGALLLGATAFAAPLNVVNWGGDGIVTANANLTNPASFSPGTIISPESNYNAQPFSGDYFHSGTGGPNLWQIFANSNLGAGSNKDWIQLAYTANTTSVNVHQALIFFRQSDFLAYDSLSGGVTLDDTTTMQYRARRTGGLTAETEHRMVISIGSNYYITSSLGTQGGTAGGDLVTLADPTAASWFNFTPETSVASSSIGSAANIVSGGQITGITGMGLWFNNSRGTTSGNLNMNITDISFAAIPEPSSIVLLGIALGSVFLFRRRKA